MDFPKQIISNEGEVFTPSQIWSCVDAFLEFGEQTLHKTDQHGGYFSGGGFAARGLRALKETIDRQEKGQ